MKGLSLYFHLPFCMSKCSYCHFYSLPIASMKLAAWRKIEADYCHTLLKELALYLPMIKSYQIKSLYFGGGTPSLIDPSYLKKILGYLQANCEFSQNCEITLEVNPKTIDETKAIIYQQSGINRVSVGLQAWQDKLLRLLARNHSQQDFIKIFQLLRNCQFHNLNVDLIFSLPGQTLEDWQETLKAVVDLNPEHISCYSLEYHPGTKIYQHYTEKLLQDGANSQDRQYYDYTRFYLEKHGFKHYEVSNFARDGQECIHNQLFWHFEPYLGIGASAHSFFDQKHFENPRDIFTYQQKIASSSIAYQISQKLSHNELMAEYILVGLRLLAGINYQTFQARFSLDLRQILKPEIDDLIQKKLISANKDKLIVTPHGLNFLDIITKKLTYPLLAN